MKKFIVGVDMVVEADGGMEAHQAIKDHIEKLYQRKEIAYFLMAQPRPVEGPETA